MSTALVTTATAFDRRIGRDLVRVLTLPPVVLGLALVAALAAPSLLVDGSLRVVLLLTAATALAVIWGGALVARRRLAPVWAAEATSDALAGAATSGSLHGWVEGLDLPGTRVGHLALNAAGGFAVTSTWATTLTGTTQRELAETALDDAALSHAVLRERGSVVTIRPLVAVWGPAGAALPAGGVEVGEVLVINGLEVAEFLRWSAVFGGAWSMQAATDCLLDLHDVPAADRVLAPVR